MSGVLSGTAKVHVYGPSRWGGEMSVIMYFASLVVQDV